MKIQSPPKYPQLSWPAAIALTVGTIVRDTEGETGTVLEREWQGKTYKRVQWDDGCVTPLDRISRRRTGIHLLRPVQSQTPHEQPSAQEER